MPKAIVPNQPCAEPTLRAFATRAILAVQMPNGTGRSRLEDLCLRRHRLAHGEENAGHTAWTRKRSRNKKSLIRG